MKKIFIVLVLFTLFYSCDNRDLVNPVINYHLQIQQGSPGGLVNSQFTFDLNVIADSGFSHPDSYTLTNATFLSNKGTLTVNGAGYAAGMGISLKNVVTYTPTAAGSAAILFTVTNNHGVSHTDTFSLNVQTFSVQFSVSDSAAVDTAYLNTATSFDYIISVNQAQTGADTAKFTFAASFLSGGGNIKVNNVSYQIGQPIAQGKSVISFTPTVTGEASILLKAYNSAGVTEIDTVNIYVAGFKSVPFTLASAIGTMYWPGTSIVKKVIRPNDTIPFSITLTSGSPSMTYTISAFSGDGQLKDASLNNINIPATIAEGTTNFNLQIYGEPTGSHTATFTITDANSVSHTTSITYTVSTNEAPTLSNGTLAHQVGTYASTMMDCYETGCVGTPECSWPSGVVTSDKNTTNAHGQEVNTNITASHTNGESFIALLNFAYTGGDADGYVASYTVTGSNAYGNFSFSEPIGTPIQNAGNNGNPPSTNSNLGKYLDFYQVTVDTSVTTFTTPATTRNNSYLYNNGQYYYCDWWLTIRPTTQCTVTIFDNEGAASGTIQIYTNSESPFNTYANNPSNF